MSFMAAEVQTLQDYESTTEYHLSNAKAIDLIAEEFGSRNKLPSPHTNPSPPAVGDIIMEQASLAANATPNVVVVSAVPGATTSLTNAANVIFTTANMSNMSTTGIPVSVVSGLTQPAMASTLAAAEQLSTVTIDLNASAAAAAAGQQASPAAVAEETNGGVLLCNLDELSRYIPENFYTDFNLDSNNLEAITTVSPAVATGATQITTQTAGTKLTGATASPLSLSLANGTTILQAAPMTTIPGNLTPVTNVTTMSNANAPQLQSLLQSAVPSLAQLGSPTTTVSTAGGPITIQLPTQPQPVQAMKSVQYVMARNSPSVMSQPSVTTSSFQPVKLTTTGFAITPSGERIAIQGLVDPGGRASTVQVQMKPHTQTLQLQGLNIDPTKLTVVQELPDVGKVVIQEQNKLSQDSISNILEEMRSADEINTASGVGPLELATAIPVAVTTLDGDPKRASIKRLQPGGALPAGAFTLPGGKKGTQNIIFAGNTLPAGAIPVQVSGLQQPSRSPNPLQISAVKSMPMPLNLGNLTPTTGAPLLTTATLPQIFAAKKSQALNLATINRSGGATVPITLSTPGVSSSPMIITSPAPASPIKTAVRTPPKQTPPKPSPLSGGSSGGGVGSTGNNKTCNWVFENGEVCGKTFSKSYNLVVHMRMHEDVRPFHCSLCDQTFRQKAHLQRHETTHGIGVKVNRGAAATGISTPKRRRKRPSRGGGPSASGPSPPPQPIIPPGSQLQERLARVEEQFAARKAAAGNDGSDGDEENDESYSGPPVVKSYKRAKFSSANTMEVIDTSVVAAVGGAEGAQIIELADGEAFLAAATGTDKDGHKIKTSTGIVEVQLASGQQNNNLQAGALVALGKPAELRDEDIIESMAPMTTIATTTANSNVITLTSPDQTFTKTIVIENFSDHPPEMQKDILNAILNSDVGLGASTATAPSGEMSATTMVALPPPLPQTQPPPIVEAQPIAISMEAVKQPTAIKAGEDEKEGAFPPITVSEFEAGSAADAGQEPAEDLTTS